MLNVLFVAGAAATAAPLKVEPPFFYLYLPMMMLVLLLFRGYITLGANCFRRWQGVVLVTLYVGFVLLALKLGVTLSD